MLTTVNRLDEQQRVVEVYFVNDKSCQGQLNTHTYSYLFSRYCFEDMYWDEVKQGKIDFIKSPFGLGAPECKYKSIEELLDK